MKKRALLLFLACLTLACNSPRRTKATSDKPRIVSLAPSITRQLIELNLSEHLVGITSFCDLASEREDLIIGNAMEVNIEQLLLCKPTIVLCTTLTNQKTIDICKVNGIKVEIIEGIQSYDEICSNFMKLARMFDKKQAADSILNLCNNQLKTTMKSVPAQQINPTVFMQIGAEPLFTITSQSYLNDVISMAKGNNIAKDLKLGSISKEFVFKQDPDFIFIVTMGSQGMQEEERWKSYHHLKAVKSHHVYTVDSSIACTPTPESFVATFISITSFIYNNTLNTDSVSRSAVWEK